MAIYERSDSPYFWMSFPKRDGIRPKPRSTDIRVPVEKADYKIAHAQAMRIFEKADAEFVLKRNGLGESPTRPPRLLRQQMAWFLTNVSPTKRSHYTDISIVNRLTRGTITLDDGRTVTLPELLLSALTKNHVIQWRAARLHTVTASTVNSEVKVLKSILKSAIPDYLETSPLDGLEKLKGPEAQVAILTDEDEKKLLPALAAPDRALVLVALDTLIRLGDLLDLKWSDLHRTPHGYEVEVVYSKTGDPYRVPLSSRAKAAIDTLPKTDAFIFTHRRLPGADKNPIQQDQQVGRMLERACQAAGVVYGRKVGGITFHSLRHTGATRMLQRGIDIRTVQDLGGWKNLTQLQRYVKTHTVIARAAVELIGNAKAAPRLLPHRPKAATARSAHLPKTGRQCGRAATVPGVGAQPCVTKVAVGARAATA